MDARPLSARRRAALLAVAIPALAMLALVASACTDDGEDPADASATSTTLDAGAAAATTTTMVTPVGEPVGRLQLVVGDCFNRYDSIDVFTRVPCEGEHAGEVFHFENHPAPFGDPYPSDRDLRTYALQVCYAQFQPFVGVLYEVSMLEIGAFTPPKENWEDSKARYRGIICYVTAESGEPLVGTMRGRAE